MKKIVIALFVISIVSFGALKGGLWYFTQQFVDNQIFHAKPFAQISYDEIKTSFAGSATVTGIKVYLPLFDDSISIESVQFIAPDLMTLITLNNQLENKQIPESLNLIITGASVNLTGKLMKMIDNPDIEPTQMEVFSTLACGDVYRIGSQALAKMGYDTLTSDILLKYHFNARKKTLNYTLNNDIRDFSRINISGELTGVRDLNSLRTRRYSLEI
ncbi:hypothetical protein [sulfur-oxidizing endosymbiont of Gigantopelta aegis]|uniref:hypothetical protein n=1 Tax=sulfur-oxidizing endosymbiont of Gigantopelta aegis TaxID=2794934 RepID=UPI0018DCF3F2|nr:hypothetical protein [sulfur-oxidizing endosymbiont of Gigantopelta aegis]